MIIQAKARERVESFLAQTPEATVNEIARWLNGRGHGIGRHVIAEVRREFLVRQPTAPVVAPVATPASVAAPTPPPEPQPMPAQQAAIVEPKSTCKQRRDLVIELLDRDPSLHPDAVKTAVRAKYGTAVAAEFVYDCCRMAREDAGLAQLPERVVVGEVASATRQDLPALDVAAMPPLEALRAVADVLKAVGAAHTVDATLTLRSGKVGAKFDLMQSGEFEV